MKFAFIHAEKASLSGLSVDSSESKAAGERPA
jgi:hypothetical protein